MTFVSRTARDADNQEKRSSLTCVLIGLSSLRQSGISWSRPMGSITAPERMCAPTSEHFSTTTTVVSGESCLSRIAAASPAGPAPTITTSNSIASRAGSSSALIGFSKARALAYEPATTVAMNREGSTPFTPPGPEALLRHCAKPERAMTNTDRKEAARALLDFYREAGVDVLLGETPTDRFASEQASAAPIARAEVARPKAEASTAARSVPVREREPPGRTTAAVPASPDAAVMAARAAAKGAASLEELRALLDRFEGCALRTTATQLVFADGNPQARVMFVGEAPGRDEDIEGLPFVGRSGKLLDRMMSAIGLDRTSAYIANIVPWRPPGNRTPTPQESAICLPFTLRQIELADPDILICLGNPSTQTLLNSKDGILKTRGRWFPFHTGTREIRAMATLHPAYLLRQPLQKRLAWRDFLAIKKALAN